MVSIYLDLLTKIMGYTKLLFGRPGGLYVSSPQRCSYPVAAHVVRSNAAEKYCVDHQYGFDQIKSHREQHAMPVLNNLDIILKTQATNSLPKSPPGMALQYTLSRWDKLNVYFQDGNLKIDKKLVKNSIRPVAIGRKNYLFPGNHEAAERSAML